MAVELILGPAAGGKTTYVQQEIKRLSEIDPEQSILYIVPEQSTLKVQQLTLHMQPSHSLLGTEILSFNRLAHRIFSEIGVPPVSLLSDMGKCMVLYKIARDHQDELVYYGRSVGQQGFIGQLKLMVTELYQYHLGEKELEELCAQAKPGSILAAKLADITKIWKYFQEYTAEKAIASEAVLDLLAQRIGESELVKNAYVFIDDFTGFTPQQYRILRGLALHSKGLSIALSLTPDAFKMIEKVQSWQNLPRNIFFTAAKTAWKVMDLAKECHLPLRVTWKIEDSRCKELVHVNEQLHRGVSKAYEGNAQAVRAYAAANQREELEEVFHEVLRLVRDEGYAYRDIALVAADLSGYAHGLRRMMQLYQMPGFIDEKSDITLNPYVRWINALGEWASKAPSYEALFGALKTGLTELSTAELDYLENQAIKENWYTKERMLEGLRRQQWGEEADTPFSRLADALDSFLGKVKGKRKVQEFTEAYQQLAESQQIEARLAEQAKELEEQGDLLGAAQYSRIFEVVKELWEQLCDVMGSVTMDMAEYTAVLSIGLGQSKLGQVPPALDELLAADLGRSKLSSYRAVFILGLQEGSFPKITSGQSLLTQKERSQASARFELAQGEKENLMEQYYLLYTVMGKARERLYFFCSQSGSDGKALGESALWKNLDRTLGAGYELEKSSTVTRPLPFLYESGRSPSGSAGKWLAQHGYEDLLTKMQQAKKPKAAEAALDQVVAHRLMDPEQRLLSVSQLEKYAECPFEYFLRYGLRLKEREQPQVRSLEDGNVLHDILQEAGQYLTQVLSEEAAEAVAEELAGLKAEEYAVYQTTGRYRYYWLKLQRAAARALQVLTKQVQLGDFEPVAFEQRFGNDAVAPLTVSLPDGGQVKLQGKIDRVDLWQQEEQRYVRIIDYKSGRTEYSAAQMFAGLQLQLPVYLEAGQQGYAAQPAGFFYFHLIPEKTDGQKAADFEKEMMKSARLDGLFLNNLDVADHMDHALREGAQVLKARLTKDNAFYSTDHTATAEQFEALKEFTHEKIAELASGMQMGRITRQPVETGDYQACQYCEYKNACPFDEKLPGNNFRKIENLKDSDFWQKIGAAEGGAKK